MKEILNYLQDDNWYKIFDAENEEDIEYKLLERKEVQTLLEEIERLTHNNENLNKVNIELSTLNTSLRSDRDNYKYIINKAIEYIESRHIKAGVELMSREKELLDILKGE